MAKQTQKTSAATDPENVNATATSSTEADTPKKRGRQPGQKSGPRFPWNTARDRALLSLVRSGERDFGDMVEILTEHKAFEGDAHRLNAVRVRDRYKALRAGAIKENGETKLPDLGLGYKPDFAALEAEFFGEGADA